jgi:predicted phosphodiesterase
MGMTREHMKLAIISDTHDNLANLEKFLTSWAKENRIETIIHCGDIASGDTVEFLAKQFFRHYRTLSLWQHGCQLSR